MRALSCLVVAAACAAAVAQPAADPWKLDAAFKAGKPEDFTHVESAPPPAGAVVLFNGTDLSKWAKRNGGGDVKWTLRPGGVMEGVKGHGDVVTKDTFGGTFKLHVEFRVPYEPGGAGQGRGNSGVYVQGRYEVQVLDSYGLTSKNNDCAAIYEVAAPTKNVCKAPTVWQSYDIHFTAPVFDGKEKREPARMTVYHNGVKVHDDVRIPVDNTRAGAGGDPATPGPILLQDHGHPVQYRNIWLLRQ